MKRKLFSEERIAGIVKELEAGAVATDLCRRHGIASRPVVRASIGYFPTRRDARQRGLKDQLQNMTTVSEAGKRVACLQALGRRISAAISLGPGLQPDANMGSGPAGRARDLSSRQTLNWHATMALVTQARALHRNQFLSL